jgi:hypothetical protein
MSELRRFIDGNDWILAVEPVSLWRVLAAVIAVALVVGAVWY